MTTKLDAKSMSVREARANFSDLLGSVHYTNQPVVIERNGKPYAVVISPAQYAAIEAQAERDWELIDRIGERNMHLDPDEAEADLTRIVEEVRQEMYEERQRAASDRH
jgi:prevent-host-death family protein